MSIQTAEMSAADHAAHKAASYERFPQASATEPLSAEAAAALTRIEAEIAGWQL